MTTGGERRRNRCRLNGWSLTAGRYRPPCRDEDIRLLPARMWRVGSMQTEMCQNRHGVPPCPSRPHLRDGVFRIPHSSRPLMSLAQSRFVFSCPIHARARNVFTLHSAIKGLASVSVIARTVWATVSRPLIEESRLRFHLLNSVGEPGGGVEN